MSKPVHNRSDLTGQIFGKLKVLRFAGPARQRYAAWECECRCGTIVTRSSQVLRTGITRSCGCLGDENRYTGKTADLTGQVFGPLRVVRFAYPKRPSWECECSCGTTGVIVAAENLRAGHTRSCGCLRQGGIPSRRVLR
jgi:hypothetical protein